MVSTSITFRAVRSSRGTGAPRCRSARKRRHCIIAQQPRRPARQLSASDRFYLFWDGADELGGINQHVGNAPVYAARYNADRLRVTMQDTADGSFPTQHEYTLGLGGVLYDTLNSTLYTPGVSQNVNSTDSFFHTDWLGSTRYLSDSTGNAFPSALRYDAFGNRTDTSSPYDPTPFQFGADWGYQSLFASGPESGSGLQYLQQRYYDPAIGRFISRDPLGFAGGLNLYGYAENDPVMNLDPSGLLWKQILSAVGGIAGAALGAPEGGIGALPGAAWGSGFGSFLGSRLDGDSVGRAAVNGVTDGALTYVGGKLVAGGVAADQARQAASASGELAAARQGLVGVLAAAAYNRWLQSLPFESGSIVEQTFETAKGPIVLLASAVVNGRTLELRDIIVWSLSGEEFSGQVGLARVLAARAQIVQHAAELGFDAVRIVARRITGKTRDKVVDFTVPVVRIQ